MGIEGSSRDIGNPVVGQSIRFRVVPKRRLWGQAHAEAMHQFLAHGIHLTEHRTGVLIFASVAERYAEIVADSGINAKVQPESSEPDPTARSPTPRKIRSPGAIPCPQIENQCDRNEKRRANR
jgi:hypothetical protein